ncbi:MAG: OmpA family protein [Oceanihabitans sp.]
MKNSILIFTLFTILTTSCVSPKVYKDLESKYAALMKENRKLSQDYENLSGANNKTENDYAKLKTEYDEAVESKNKLQENYKAIKANYDNLKASYEALEKNSSASIAQNAKKNRELLAKLEAKEQALEEENNRLDKLKKELESRSNRIDELEKTLADKDAAMTKLKNAISKALTNFEGKGLTVEQRDGKVYVSMENKLLFKSGSWAVGKQGKEAVMQLGSVLGDNPEISVLIEGHTDNDPYTGSGQIAGNWDLSTKRATAIVAILQENKAINPESLTAAGRGEFAPIASNETAEGKAKNRRIEVILAPKLDTVSKLLNDI